MRRIKLRIILIWATLSLSILGCTSTSIQFNTTPKDAKVFIKPVGSSHLKHIGNTPFKIDHQNIQKELKGSGAAYVEIRKAGFKTDSLFITETSNIDLNINRQLSPIKDFEKQQWLNTQIENLFEVKRLVGIKRYDEALRIIQTLKKETPYVASIHEMEGGLFLLKGRNKDALDAFRKAKKYNPESVDSTKMVRHLERVLGVPHQYEFYENEAFLRKPAETKKEEKK